MSMHKLTAGSGYDYLTRQVAALDSTEKGHTGLAAYYTDRGEKARTQTVAGYDLTFSPVRSVSTLWAVAVGRSCPQVAAKKFWTCRRTACGCSSAR